MLKKIKWDWICLWLKIPVGAIIWLSVLAARCVELEIRGIDVEQKRKTVRIIFILFSPGMLAHPTLPKIKIKALLDSPHFQLFCGDCEWGAKVVTGGPHGYQSTKEELPIQFDTLETGMGGRRWWWLVGPMGGVFLGQGRSTASSALIRGYTIQCSRTSKREVRGNVSVRNENFWKDRI